MILAFDTYYFNSKAKTTAILFKDWTDEEPIHIYSEVIEGIAEYESGAFYKRELPCILSLLKQIDTSLVELIIIDGYTLLDNKGSIGLGGHLYEELNRKFPIVGIAKTEFWANKDITEKVLRGESSIPLHITTIGIDSSLASRKVESMHGNYRIPTLLQLLDANTKEGKRK